MNEIFEHDDGEMSGKAKGGKARSAKMTPEERRASALKAAEAKKEKAALPTVIKEGSLRIGETDLDVAVLENGKRVVTVTSVFEALGRTQRGYKKSVDNQRFIGEIQMPPFMDAMNLIPYVNQDLKDQIPKIKYKTQSGLIKEGYNVLILPLVGDLYLRAREDGAIKTKEQHAVAHKAEVLVRSLAKVGIIALVDEATGYQRERKRDALAAILEKLVSKEMRPWLKTFQLDFFEELCRVWGYAMPEKPGAYPPVFAHVIRDIVYDRLAPGVREQLQALKKKNGGKLHQFLTVNAGYNDLNRHLGELTMLLRVTPNGAKEDFMATLDRIKPKLTVDELIDAYNHKQINSQ